MHGSYVESFKDLYHGTIESFAASIVETQTFIPSKEGWCGPGVYFYDNKSKAWWSACRTCRYEKEKGNNDAIADIVIADIKPLKKELILDLRAPKDLETFANFVNTFLSQNNFESEENIDPLEWLKQKRAMLLSFYCQENNIQLIVGYFK